MPHAAFAANNFHQCCKASNLFCITSITDPLTWIDNARVHNYNLPLSFKPIQRGIAGVMLFQVCA